MHTGRLTKAHWRKSAQWFAMSRPLAAVVARDDHVAPVFERECYTYAPNGKVPPPPHVKARTHAGFFWGRSPAVPATCLASPQFRAFSCRCAPNALRTPLHQT